MANHQLTLESLFDEYIAIKAREAQIIALLGEHKSRVAADLKEKNQMLQDALTEKEKVNG